MPEKRKKTSAAAKNRLRDKKYRRWETIFTPEEFEEIEAARGEKSRADFLRELMRLYKKNNIAKI